MALTTLLVVFRTVEASRIATLIDFDDIPILRSVSLRYTGFWYALVIAVAAHLSALIAWLEERARDRTAVLAVTILFAITALVANRPAVPSAVDAGAGGVGLLDWAALGLALAATWLQAGAMLSVRPSAERSEASTSDQPSMFVRTGLAYVLVCGFVMAYSIRDHVSFWMPGFNGGHDYRRFFAAGEWWSANLVLYSTSALFATCAAVLGLSAFQALRFLGGTGSFRASRVRREDSRRQAALLGLVWPAAQTVPSELRLIPEIALDRSWMFPAASILAGVLILTLPILLCRQLVDRDFEALGQASTEMTERSSLRPEASGLWPLLLFPIYPLMRRFVLASRSRTAATALLVAASATVLAWLTRLVVGMDAWYELPEWRGMYHSTLVPSLRVFVSFLWAWLAYVGVHIWWLTPRQSVTEFTPRDRPASPLTLERAVVGAVVLTVVLASWPFWGWGNVSVNVLARTHEFSTRHEFELRVLHALFDLDRDGYASVLHGPDPNGWDASVAGDGFRLPEQAAPPDRFLVSQPDKARRMPSVVLLYLEGIAPAAISAYGQRSPVDLSGRPIPATPHIDAIAADGVRFTNARSHYPATWPGWLAINTGRSSYLGELSYSSFLKQTSQHSNLYDVLRLAGVSRWCHPDMAPFFNLFVPESLRATAWKPTSEGYSTWVSSHEEALRIWRGDKRTQRMLEFIDDLSIGDRFFLSEHMNDTHVPWRRTPLGRARDLGFEQGLEVYESDAVLPDGRRPDDYGRYFQVITRTDAQIGAIVDALKAKGLYDDTLFVLIGGHGYQWYEHEHEQHVTHLYDPALRIPLIIKAPGVRAGATVDAPVLQVDLLPTVMEVAGVSLDTASSPVPLTGVSLVPLLEGGPTDDQSAAFRDRDVMLATYFDNQGIISGFRHKLIFNKAAGTYLPFDLDADPAELHNLADDRPDLLASLMAKYRAYARSHEAYLSGNTRQPGD